MARRVISWEERLADVIEKNIIKYVENFSEEKVIPAIEVLLDFDETDAGEEILGEFDRIVDSLYDKFDSMVDIQAGKLWTDSQIQVGAEKGFKEYVSISERDKSVCDFCDEMDGEIISIEPVIKQIGDGEEQEFIDVDDLDEMDDISESGLRPPYHPLCRCRVALLEGETKVEKGGPGSGNFGHEGRPGEVGGSALSGGGEKETVYHGTSADKMYEILFEGVQPQESHNWDASYYEEGGRGG